MTYELTEKEAELTRMLLIEELDQVNQLIEESDANDIKELTKQAEMMQAIIDKLIKVNY